MSHIELLEEHRSFDGMQYKYRHQSTVLDCSMTFSVFLPNKTIHPNPPLLWWLSGLTCTDDNFTHKSGVQQAASDMGIAIVMPDTSPRGDNVPDSPDYDLGQGASFYLNATQAPWHTHYQMYDYLINELTEIVHQDFKLTGPEFISGHSMGGHGALVLGLKNPDRFQSITAFAPIVTPSQVPWGIKAFNQYLGTDSKAWANWDATSLMTHYTGRPLPILIDQGTTDTFYPKELEPDKFVEAADGKANVTFRLQEGHDHSYYTIATFIKEHLAFHLKTLR